MRGCESGPISVRWRHAADRRQMEDQIYLFGSPGKEKVRVIGRKKSGVVSGTLFQAQNRSHFMIYVNANFVVTPELRDAIDAFFLDTVMEVLRA